MNGIKRNDSNNCRIAFAIDTNTSGGAERVIANLANYFADEGYTVDLINSDTVSAFYELNEGVNVIKMGIDRSAMNKIARAIYKIKFLLRYYQKYHPDAVIAFLFNMESAAIISGIISKTRVFTSVRNSANSYPLIERLFRKAFYPLISGVVFQSKSVMLHTDFRRVKNKTIIMNPISNKYLAIETIVPYTERKKWIISVGRLNAQKNQRLLIDAFCDAIDETSDFELHIFGKGPLNEELQNYAASTQFKERIVFEGEVADAILNNKDAYLFVLSSDYEGFPNALTEAMSVGIPSISTDFDSGVAGELITDGINGYITKVGDVAGLSMKIKKAIEMPEDEYIQMAKRAADLTRQLSVDVIGKQWEQFLFR